jgi:hypothetical protein
MRPLTFWPSWNSDSESVGRVDFDRFPERKVSSTFLLMVSTLNRKFSYDKINVLGKKAPPENTAFNELVYLKSRPPVLHELRDISIGLIADQNGCPYLVKKLFDLDPRIDRATEGDEYAMLRYVLYKASNGLADLQVFNPIDLPIHDWWVVF